MKKVTYHEIEDDFEGIAKTFIQEANARHIPVEQDEDQAKHMIKTDLRDALPPQIYALISKITSVIEMTTSSKMK